MKQRAQPWLGTLVEVSIADTLDEATLNHCFSQAFAAVARVHRLMSFHDLDSDVSRLNRAAIGATIEVDAATWTVLQCALSLGHASGGIFDIGCAPLLAEWGYLPALAAAMPARVAAHDMLRLQPASRVEKTDAGWIDLGGIAKGYAVDAATDALRAHGVKSACVNAGGDLRVFGEREFQLLVRDPRHPTTAGAGLSLRERALATSAGYFSRKCIDGRSYSALVDSRNGQPVTAAISASVLAPSCMLADALTKVIIASGNATHPALQTFDAEAFIL